MKKAIDVIDYFLQYHPFASIFAILILAGSVDSIVNAIFKAIGV